MAGCYGNSKEDRHFEQKLMDHLESDYYEDSLELTFRGKEHDLDIFLLKLREAAQELAKEHGVEVEGA